MDACGSTARPRRLAAAHARAARLARTWQSGELFDDLLVDENLAVAAGRARRRWRIAFRSRADQRAIDETLALFDLAWAAKASPADLPQGHRKLVGVARALAARPRLLLLDEPAAGLDTTESEALGAHLRAIADGGQSTLLIDHDMGLVLEHLRPRRRARVRRGDRGRAAGDGAHATRA